jgi:AcrR family transcriptional regulator
MSVEPRPYVQRRRAAARAETRSRILRAAREQIPSADGALPVAEIASNAGVAIQTIYDQFGSKGGLLIAIIEDVQQELGLYRAFDRVFSSPHGEAAMRRMIKATVDQWHGAWPYLEYLLRARRVDPVVAAEMDFIDRLRHAHYWAITERIHTEGRVAGRRSARWAADQAFALTNPTVYEELVVRRRGSVSGATQTMTQAVLGVILELGSRPVTEPAPDWPALEQAAADRARRHGSDPSRLSRDWSAKPSGPTTGGRGSASRSGTEIRRAGRPRA